MSHHTVLEYGIGLTGQVVVEHPDAPSDAVHVPEGLLLFAILQASEGNSDGVQGDHRHLTAIIRPCDDKTLAYLRMIQ